MREIHVGDRITTAEELDTLPVFSTIVIGHGNGVVPGAISAQKDRIGWLLPGVDADWPSDELVHATAYDFYADVVYVGEGAPA